MKKKILAILLTITTICATLFSATVSVSAASNVSFGKPSSSNVTIYCNDTVKAKTTVTIPMTNYNGKYTYYAVSDNKTIATVSGKVTSSKITLTVYAKKVGTTVIKVYAKNRELCKRGRIQNVTRRKSFRTPVERLRYE